MKGHWYSESKKTWTPVAELADGHLHNAKRKLERGDYLLPSGEPLPAHEHTDLMSHLDAEIAKREAARPPQVEA